MTAVCGAPTLISNAYGCQKHYQPPYASGQLRKLFEHIYTKQHTKRCKYKPTHTHTHALAHTLLISVLISASEQVIRLSKPTSAYYTQIAPTNSQTLHTNNCRYFCICIYLYITVASYTHLASACHVHHFLILHFLHQNFSALIRTVRNSMLVYCIC